MSQADNAGGAGNAGGGAADQNSDSANNQNSQNKNSAEPKVVPHDDHKRALDDMHRFKAAAKEAAERAAKLQQEMEAIKAESLRAKEDYKSLYETTQQKLAEKEQESSRLKQSVVYAERYRAVLPVLKEAGLRDDAMNLLEMVSLDDIEVEATTNGRFICNGMDRFAESFKARYPFAFKEKQMPNVNTGGGQGKPNQTGPMDAAALFRLEQECKRKGDMQPYYEAVRRYKVARVK